MNQQCFQMISILHLHTYEAGIVIKIARLKLVHYNGSQTFAAKAGKYTYGGIAAIPPTISLQPRFGFTCCAPE